MPASFRRAASAFNWRSLTALSVAATAASGYFSLRALDRRLDVLRDQYDDTRIAAVRALVSPAVMLEDLPVTPAIERKVETTRQAIGSVLGEVPNRLTLEGHTDAAPFLGGDRGYSNWELSSDRANASRRELMAGGLPEDRTLRVQGLAASSLFEPQDPLAPTNRRISIIVMNREAEERVLRPAAPEEPEKADPAEKHATPVVEPISTFVPPAR